MTQYPIERVRKDKLRIEAWLVQRGAQVLVPTNEWELVRYQAGKVTGVVYCSMRGHYVTTVGGADVMLGAFYTNKAWTAGVSTARALSKAFGKMVPTLLERDGDACFYCGQPLGLDLTREHLVPLTSGGTNHIANIVLAHKVCNQRAGALSVMEKIRMREDNIFGKMVNVEVQHSSSGWCCAAQACDQAVRAAAPAPAGDGNEDGTDAGSGGVQQVPPWDPWDLAG